MHGNNIPCLVSLSDRRVGPRSLPCSSVPLLLSLLRLESMRAFVDVSNMKIHLLGIGRDELVELRLGPVRGVVGRDEGRLLGVVRGQVREQPARQVHARLVVGGGEVRHAALLTVHTRAAQLLGLTRRALGYRIQKYGLEPPNRSLPANS